MKLADLKYELKTGSQLPKVMRGHDMLVVRYDRELWGHYEAAPSLVFPASHCTQWIAPKIRNSRPWEGIVLHPQNFATFVNVRLSFCYRLGHYKSNLTSGNAAALPPTAWIVARIPHKQVGLQGLLLYRPLGLHGLLRYCKSSI